MFSSSAPNFSFGISSSQQQAGFDPTQSNFFPDLSFSSSQPFNISQPFGTQDSSNLDPNNVDTFKENLSIVQNHVREVRSLAQSALSGMYALVQTDSERVL